jgi:hypothetical protein
LAEPTVTACATRLFGPDRSSRNIVRALVTLLTRARIAWWQLAVAVAAAPIVRHEALAQALLAPVEEPADEPLPFRDDVRCARAGLALVGVARAERLLRDALGGPVGGPRRLVAAMRSLLEVERDLPWPPPGRLQDLEEACLRVAVLNPRPLVRPAPPAAPVAGQRRAAPPVAEPAWGIARRAPAVAGPTPPQDAPLPRSELAQSLCSIRLGGALELVAPRTTTELAGWGRLLGNCLAEFGPAVAAGATVILGVRDGGVLVAALEVREGRIVQLLGPRNRLPPEHLSDVVVRGVLAAL